MEVSSPQCGKPLRDVVVDYGINEDKCRQCKDKPCITACPIDAVYLDKSGDTQIGDKCFGCILCRNACPYDAIEMDVKLAEPIKENVPNINKKLCRACGACVNACKTGAIHLESSGSEEIHSVIDEDKCTR